PFPVTDFLPSFHALRFPLQSVSQSVSSPEPYAPSLHGPPRREARRGLRRRPCPLPLRWKRRQPPRRHPRRRARRGHHPR
uniref:Uncharacterized protein n=1 Tax=Aegilops tauschii subsp. strangulata TaxID=200361 RepID=A0A453DMV0_AEGTS